MSNLKKKKSDRISIILFVAIFWFVVDVLAVIGIILKQLSAGEIVLIGIANCYIFLMMVIAVKG